MADEIKVDDGNESLEDIADELAEAIRIGDTDTWKVRSLLLEFAAEIKRRAIEP